jgi:hypothetical protein
MKFALAVALLLCAASSFAAADLAITPTFQLPALRAGSNYDFVLFTVTNQGPDTASNFSIAITGDVAVTCQGCDPGDIAPRGGRSIILAFTTPIRDGLATITATVSSATPDDYTANNTASLTFPISTAPDLVMSLGVPDRQDVSRPFTVDVGIGNLAVSDAHNVTAAVDFRSDLVLTSLPDGCTTSGMGRVICHLDVVPAHQPKSPPRFRIGFSAPQYGEGKLQFTGAVIENENDFDSDSNKWEATTTLYKSFTVTSTADSGAGSLRQAILDSNAACAATNCAIEFAIAEASAAPWKTVRVSSPLPAVASDNLRIDGSTQGASLPPHNPDGPDIEISGSAAAGDGLTIASCNTEIENVAVNGFPGNGLSLVDAGKDCGVLQAFVHDLFVGTDPTGSAARPNLRGVGTSFRGSFAPLHLDHCVISGNTRSGVFDMSGRLWATRNRIGLKAHADEPLPNGNAGIYVGESGADIGNGYFDTADDGNFIAFNGQMGIAVAATTIRVAIRDNRIWGNAGLGIDVGLDGPGTVINGIAPPVLTLAHYDPLKNQTIIEGDSSVASTGSPVPNIVQIFANDALDLSGLAQAQRPVSGAFVNAGKGVHFSAAINGDLTGQYITATVTQVDFEGFAKAAPNGVDQGFETQTSEISRPIQVR